MKEQKIFYFNSFEELNNFISDLKDNMEVKYIQSLDMNKFKLELR